MWLQNIKLCKRDSDNLPISAALCALGNLVKVPDGTCMRYVSTRWCIHILHHTCTLLCIHRCAEQKLVCMRAYKRQE